MNSAWKSDVAFLSTSRTSILLGVGSFNPCGVFSKEELTNKDVGVAVAESVPSTTGSEDLFSKGGQVGLVSGYSDSAHFRIGLVARLELSGLVETSLTPLFNGENKELFFVSFPLVLLIESREVNVGI